LIPASLLSRLARSGVLFATVLAGAYAVPIQSPIDIRSDDAVFASLPSLMFSFSSDTSLDLLNNGAPSVESTIRANLPSGAGALTVGGVLWPLVQFHFHTESEHTVNGVGSDMELHMVFQQPTDEYLVVGRFLDAGSFNPLMDTIFSNLPTAAGATFHVPSFDLSGLLPGNLESFRYTGSLTTPPFTEGVNWVMLNQPMELSQAQIDSFRDLFPDGNERDIQALNGRTIRTDVRGFASSVPEPGTFATAAAVGMLILAIGYRRRTR
jgi:carbonic anhydrase